MIRALRASICVATVMFCVFFPLLVAIVRPN